MKSWLVGSVVALGALSVAQAADQPARFWNLTRNTITKFYLAPTGTTQWGKNQTANDKDGSVDNDERLRVTDTPAGIYDAKFEDKAGRTCTVPALKVEPGQVFSIEEGQLKSCS